MLPKQPVFGTFHAWQFLHNTLHCLMSQLFTIVHSFNIKCMHLLFKLVSAKQLKISLSTLVSYPMLVFYVKPAVQFILH